MPSKSDDESCCNTSEILIDYTQHWNKAYTNAETEKLGWYENDPSESIALIEACNLAKNANIFIPGAGATTLVDELLNRGYNNLIANDISESALSSLRSRVQESTSIEYVIDDLTNPIKLDTLKEIDLWIDRAVLHFFIKEEAKNTYFNLLRKLVKSGGFAILAQFNLEGAKKCSGLDVYNYNAEMLQERLGNDFKLLNSFDYSYTMPSGSIRPYVYTLFQRK